MRLLQSLTRGLQALDYLNQQGGAVRLTDVADALEIEKSNAAHLLKTLVAAGYAWQDKSRRYISAKQVNSHTAGHSLEDVVECRFQWQPVLKHLVDRTGECAHLAVLVKSCVWYIDKIDSTLPLKVDHPIGSLSPLHCTALGKVFLAFGDAEMPGEFTRYTPNTITSVQALRDEIVRIRQCGFAADDEEFAQGVRCVARPVYDARGKMIAAVGVSGPSVRINDARLMELGQLIISVSAASTADYLSHPVR